MSPPESMRALQLQETGRLVEVRLPVPTPGPDEVLVRTAAATICTSDLNDIDRNPFGIALPRVPGHEGAGTVAALERLADPGLRLDSVVTHRVRFGDWARAFDLARSGKDQALKVAIMFGEAP